MSDNRPPVAPKPGDPCIEWEGGHTAANYGQTTKGEYVHRLVADAIYGLEDDQVVMHRCDNPPCFNPNHLKVGTQAENIEDARQKGRMPRLAGVAKKMAEKTHCKRGHDNWVYQKSGPRKGRRRCRTCERENNRKRYGTEEFNQWQRDYRARKKKEQTSG